MKLPKIAIANYQFVAVITFMIIAAGLLSFMGMSRSEDPQLNAPNYSIAVVYPGAQPLDLETQVVDPIEDALNELEDLVEIKTAIRDGFTLIQIESSWEVDIDDKYDEIVTAVNAVKAELPDEIVSMEINKFSPQDVKILQLALVAEEVPYRDMLDVAERLKASLENVYGLRDVEIDGYPEEQVNIALNMEKLSRLGLNTGMVMQVLQGNNLNIPGGEVDAGSRSFSIKTSGNYTNLNELRETPLLSAEGQQVLLGDVADVYMGYENDNYIARYNGEKALFVSVTQKAGFNILELDKRLQDNIDAFRSQIPDNIRLEAPFVQAPNVANRINEFFGNLLQGIVLVGLIILIFLGLRNAFIVMTVIPLSILMAITMLDLGGFGLQQLSIAGLVIALGLLVDNGIVVVENITRYLRMGLSPREAAIKGTSEVGWALVSATATTLLAFFPMTQLGGGTGQFIKTLPLIVIFSLLASLVLALAFTPVLAGRIAKTNVEGKLTRAERFMQSLVERVYRPALRWSLRYPVAVIAIGLGTLVGSFALFPLVGVSFFPTADKPMLLIDVDLPEGSSLEKTDEVAHFVESVLEKQRYVQAYATNVGHGNPQVYYNIIPSNLDPTHAQFLLKLEKWEEAPFYALIDSLRSSFEDYPDAMIAVTELKNGPPYEAPIEIKVMGENLDKIKELATSVESIIRKTEGTINTDNPLAFSKTNLRVAVNRPKASLSGVALSDIDLTVRTAINGSTVGSLQAKDGNEYDIVMRLPMKGKSRMSDFNRIHVANRNGAQLPLRQVAQLRLESGLSQIDHYDLDRTATVTADLKQGYEAAAVTPLIIDELEKMNWPAGYSYYIGGEFATQQESFGSLGQVLLVAVFGILAVLILQFRSFSQPFIILSAIPLSLSGSIVALFLSGFSFSFLAFVGFTSLVGIVVNTSIILVDYTNQLRREGEEKLAAIQRAAETRFSPILLTTMTTILGLLPLTLTGSNLWGPLGWTIIGGMVSSTLLTLLIVPILYKWLAR